MKEIDKLYFAISYEHEFSCSRVFSSNISNSEIIRRLNKEFQVEFEEIYSVNRDLLPTLITEIEN
jgi:hypothetical protein